VPPVGLEAQDQRVGLQLAETRRLEKSNEKKKIQKILCRYSQDDNNNPFNLYIALFKVLKDTLHVTFIHRRRTYGGNSGLSVLLKGTSTRAGIEPPTR